MKKSLLLVLFTLLSLSSCRIDEKKDQRVYTVFSDVIGTNIGRVRVRSDDPGVALILPPFRTSITATVYYYDGGFREEELEALDDAINFDLQYYYALSDRHYDYTLDGEGIVNVKTINEAPRGTAVAVDPFLFDLLKESYEFSLNTADDDGNLLALLAEGAGNGVGDCQAHAAADNGNAIALYFGWAAERAGNVADLVALVELGEALGGLTDDHEDELDPALLRVPVGERERDALARLVDAHHEELAGMRMLGHPGRVDAELEDLLRELRLFQDLEHRTPLLPWDAWNTRASHQARRAAAGIPNCNRAAGIRVGAYTIEL